MGILNSLIQVDTVAYVIHFITMVTTGCVNLSFAFVEGESLLMGLKDIALSSGRYGH